MNAGRRSTSAARADARLIRSGTRVPERDRGFGNPPANSDRGACSETAQGAAEWQSRPRTYRFRCPESPHGARSFARILRIAHQTRIRADPTDRMRRGFPRMLRITTTRITRRIRRDAYHRDASDQTGRGSRGCCGSDETGFLRIGRVADPHGLSHTRVGSELICPELSFTRNRQRTDCGGQRRGRTAR